MNRKTRNRNYQILALVFGIACFCCLVWLAAYLTGLNRAETEMEEIRESYVKQGGRLMPENEGTPEASVSDEILSGEASQEEHPEYGITDKTVDFAALQEEVNGDIYAWIFVPGTAIDYPVVQHPEEMDYYLEYNLDGTKGRPGGIYTQRMNSRDWTDPNTVIYGHNMRNGTMFADLHKYEDADFFAGNRYVHIYTEDGRILVYEIFAAYVTDNSHLLLTKNIYTETGFQSYLDDIPTHTGKNCNFLEEREVTSQDRILTLSTCVYGQNDKRYLVQGVLVLEEQP